MEMREKDYKGGSKQIEGEMQSLIKARSDLSELVQEMKDELVS
jgi:hypothetical protein